jgi:hypothetical protein
MAVYKVEANTPSFLVPRQFSQPGKKEPFVLLLSRLSDIFMESSDTEVLVNCATALTTMAEHKHARSEEALVQLKKTAAGLRNCIEQLLQDKAELKPHGVEGSRDAKELCDLQYALLFSMRRLAVLSKRWDVADLIR